MPIKPRNPSNVRSTELGAALTDHDHVEADITDLDHFTTAEHNAIDAADHGSGASTDGQVLTSDGAGGAAWENAVAPGHTHVEADVTDLDHDDTDAIHDNVAGEISLIAEKTTPADEDLILIEDSAASNAKKRLQIGNLPGSAGSLIPPTTVGSTVPGAVTYITPDTSRRYVRKFTLASAGMLHSVEAYLKQTTANVFGGIKIALFNDDAGTPNQLLALMDGSAAANTILFNTTAQLPRWVSIPLNVQLAAGDYWMSLWVTDATDITLGTDATTGAGTGISGYITAGGAWWIEKGATGYGFTATNDEEQLIRGVVSLGALSGAHNDHGSLDGLGDDDHTQYHNTARHAAVDAADHASGASTDGQVLTSDGAGGAAWEDATGGSNDYVLLGEATADGSAVTLTVSNIPQTHNDLLVMFRGSTNGSVFRSFSLRFNGDSANRYRYVSLATDSDSAPTRIASTGDSSFNIGRMGDDANLSSCTVNVHSYSAVANHGVQWQSFGAEGTGTNQLRAVNGAGAYVPNPNAAITSVSIITNTDQIASGSTLRVYGLGEV